MSLKKLLGILLFVVAVVLFTQFTVWMFDTLSQLAPVTTPS